MAREAVIYARSHNRIQPGLMESVVGVPRVDPAHRRQGSDPSGSDPIGLGVISRSALARPA
ncbi:hypothetical protein RugamoR64_36280 [Duganella rhizosphaerae]